MPIPYATAQPSAPAGAPVANLQAGMRGRVTLTAVAYGQLVGVGFGPGGRLGWESFLGGAPGLSSLIGVALFAWAPGDALPPDWPADDANADTGWHFEFVYRNASVAITSAVMATALGAPAGSVAVWTAHGVGPALQTRATVLTWPTSDAVNPGGSPGGQFNPGDHVRMSIAPTDLDAIASAVGYQGTTIGQSCNALLSMIQQTGFDQLVTGGTPHVLAWCGVDFLPPDWPPTDNLDNYHLEFRYQGGSPLVVAGLPFPVQAAFIAQGAGA
ncbi:MAG: hypothetical protein ACRDNM_00150 [Gaiellaceae bacterium]